MLLYAKSTKRKSRYCREQLFQIIIDNISRLGQIALYSTNKVKLVDNK